ncbi:MAG: DoxX family protein [Flavobacteriaceae bacterium]|nr:DoxX family protein [Flavobacteriaceae bacterium]
MKYYAERICSLIAAMLLIQTLYYKFMAAPESVYIFSTLRIEPFGRIGIGLLELIATWLLLFRKTSLVGAVFGLGIIIGAIFAHIFILGIEVQNDGGKLFGMAIVILVLCSTVVILQKEKLILFIRNLK